MLLLSLLTLTLLPAASAVALPRQYVPPNTCCFTLHDSSTGQIVQQQTSSGFLYLGGTQPTGWYCINLSDPNKILWDAFNNACFVNRTRSFNVSILRQAMTNGAYSRAVAVYWLW